MKSTSLRRTAARVAAAGAIALIPLAAVTIPASADIPLDNAPGDVSWPHHPHPNNGWWDRDDRHHPRDHDRDDWDHDDWNRGNCCWRNALPPTGSW
ncbi:hypothetical protein [Nocardia seriolae]|nr:hypothetical protein [Nocardia seriolae]APB00629.1 hypothetical protein NS506_06598 [Nocardia seriolae]MTJ61880.1 hypothetical protein [Nocardia seriolae]MTJ74626.1 hypothetical protein [Nocardia seriolae]MTJ90085.1 hypothetical protein [Nocardia seriolae]MTK34050.1 hypothetical protein [Nocardia seriolae]